MRTFLICLFLVSFTTIGFSQNTFEFLRNNPSPRSAAIGSGFMANYDDVNVMFYNPAGIGYLTEANPVSFSYESFFAGIKYFNASYSKSFDFVSGRFGFSVNYSNAGTFSQTDDFKNELGTFTPADIAIGVGYSNFLHENFSYGITLKYIHSTIAGITASGFAADFGLQYVIPESKLSFAFSILNAGEQTKAYFNTKEELPIDVAIGVSKGLEHLPLTFYFAFNRLNKKDESFKERLSHFNLGTELKLSSVVKLRLGYDHKRRQDIKIDSSSGLTGFNFGIGFLIKGKYNFDYSISSYGQIGSIQRIGISTDI